jgi:multiple sugar transport system substrate-binding protein
MMLCALALMLGLIVPVVAQTTELKFWTFLDPTGTDPRSQALKSVIDGYNESHPDTQVVAETIHFSQIDARVIQAAATGSGPDIVNVYSVQLPQHVAAGSIQPVTDYANAWLAENGDDYIFPIDAVTYDGEIMAMPWETRVWVLWYRQDILDGAGLELPNTLADLATVAGELRSSTDGQVSGLAIGFSEASLGADFMEKFEPLLWGFGGQLLDEEGNAAFAGPEGVQAMQLVYDMVNSSDAMGRETLSMTADDVLAGIQSSTAYMAIEGSMRVGSARSAEGIGSNLATAPVPGLTPDEPLPALVAGQTLAIGATTSNPDAAWEFIQYYLSPESQLAFAKASVMPVRASIFETPEIADSPSGVELSAWRDYARDYGRMSRYPEDFPRLSEIVVRAAQNIVFNDAPIEEALQQAADEYNAGRMAS